KNVDDFTGPRERSDLGFITFDLSADILLTFFLFYYIPIFDWNVKQLFLYLSAEYATKNNVSPVEPFTHTYMLGCILHLSVCRNQALNQVVLWDKIVLRGENTKLNLRDMKSKYFFFDDGNGL
ncbi:hypothetical protein NL108_012295, partial [Boleophthalmus pectinirostris]